MRSTNHVGHGYSDRRPPLGHSSPAIMSTAYCHLLSPEDRAANIMEAAFANAKVER
jgi:hypothetical protein